MAEKEYIEREAVAPKYRRMITFAKSDEARRSTYECLKILANEPAADVVEVRHGEWVDKPTGAYGRCQTWCSACGKHSGIGGIESNRHKPYCPNCGAKMDGGKTE